MDKISSILPKSARTQNADHSSAQPARPGAPLLGRPMGRVTQKVVFEGQQTEVPTRATPDLSFAEKFSVNLPEDKVSLGEDFSNDSKLAGYNRKGEIHKVKIAEDVNRKFADLTPLAKNEATPLSEEIVSNETDSMALASA